MSKHKNIVPCLLWVKQGGAKPKPDKITLDKDELKKLIEKTQDDLDDWEDASDASDDDDEGASPVAKAAKEKKKEEEEFTSALRKAKKMADSIKQKSKRDTDKKRKAGDEDEEVDIVDKYGLDDYDDDESPMDFLHGMGGLTPFANDDEDPYITLKNEVDSDDEDFVLKPSDNLIALGRLTEEAACLEVHVYNAEQGSLFIHHDYILPTFPLVLEWLDYDVADGEKGNFCAMGTMEPSISLWDLDVVDSLEPVAVLAGAKPMKKKKKIKMMKVETLDNGHTDAVLDLAWNKNVRNVLASASADMTVRLWDLSQGKSVSTLSHHTMPVQCISWHPVETQSLLTGSFDNTAAVIDCRSPLENVKKWDLEGEVERALWDTFSPFQFLASTDKGNVYCVDIRQEKPIFTLSAHEQAATGVALSSAIPGLLVTTSPDKCMKVWDIQDGKPTLVLKRHLHMDTLHCVSCNPDEPFVFAVGGDKDFKVWDIRESAAVRRHFLSRMPQKQAAECDGDEGDLPHVEEAMGELNMGDEEDRKEEAEMIGGDRPGGSGEEKKKKKKKKPKKKPKEPLIQYE